MLAWIFYLSLVTVSIKNVVAFPQNGPPSVAGAPGNSFEVDGFVFDGPADRPPSRPVDGSSTTSSPGSFRTTPSTTITPFTTSTSRPTTGSSGTPSPNQLDACVTNCPVTPEYNPVCGSDNVNYNNPGSLSCAAICGKAVTLNYYGPCSSDGLRG